MAENFVRIVVCSPRNGGDADCDGGINVPTILRGTVRDTVAKPLSPLRSANSILPSTFNIIQLGTLERKLQQLRIFQNNYGVNIGDYLQPRTLAMKIKKAYANLVQELQTFKGSLNDISLYY